MSENFSLPGFLFESIENLTKSLNLKTLARASEELSLRYAKGFIGGRLKAPYDHIAYLLTRLPATYAAASTVFSEIKKKRETPVKSLLDLGSGPGTAIFAALQFFPELEKVYFVEQDRTFIDFFEKVMRTYFPHLKIELVASDIREAPIFNVDLIVSSYSLNELSVEAISQLTEKITALPKATALFLEPGTPIGYQNIILVRDIALKNGKFPLAPCPHAKTCPLLNTRKWCHFSARLPRSSLHRLLKGGTLGFEDEKFSYFVSSSDPVLQTGDRIIGHPRKHGGHISFDLCSLQGEASQKVISKKMGPLYQEAKKLEWGDTLQV